MEMVEDDDVSGDSGWLGFQQHAYKVKLATDKYKNGEDGGDTGKLIQICTICDR